MPMPPAQLVFLIQLLHVNDNMLMPLAQMMF
jgi:hypothetical protein